MSIIFNIFIEFIILLLFFFNIFVFWGQGIWDLSSLSKYQTSTAPTHWISTLKTIQYCIKIESYSWDKERPVL